MEPVTLLFAGIGVVIVLASSAVNGFIAFLGLLLLYPDYLRVSLGSADISACRIVVTILLLRCVATPSIIRRLQWKPLDSLVLLSMVVFAVTLMFTTDMMEVLENRAGFIMDTFFVYLATRLVIVDRGSFVSIAKAVSFMTVFLAIHAVIETFTGKSLYTGLGQYCPYAVTKGMEYQTRYGLNRAMGPPGETIIFGLNFASLLPLIWMLRHERPPWGRGAYVLTLIGVCGVAATVSSGPYLALIVVIGCLALEYAKSLVKPLLVLFVIACMAVEIISNRHFYHVLADFTMDPGSGWYRARLIDVAIMMLPEYWKYGYGFIDPGWGPMIDGTKRTDGVNDFVVYAVLYGIFGLFAYVSVLVVAGIHAIRSYAGSTSLWVKSFAWALMSALLGVIFASWSVSLFGSMTSILYVLLGLHGCLPSYRKGNRAAQRVVAAHGGRKLSEPLKGIQYVGYAPRG